MGDLCSKFHSINLLVATLTKPHRPIPLQKNSSVIAAAEKTVKLLIKFINTLYMIVLSVFCSKLTYIHQKN
jgi:hypothetical protein